MTALDDAIRRSRSAAARTTGRPWRILPRVKRPDERATADAGRAEFTVTAHLFAPDKVDGRVPETIAQESGRYPGILGEDLALVVWGNPTGGEIRQHDIVQEVVAAPAIGRKYRISKPPGGDRTGHVRLDLAALEPGGPRP